MRTALLIIDLQNEYLKDYEGSDELETTLAYINYTKALFEERSLPVIVIKDISDGTDASYHITQLLNLSGDEILIEKMHPNSFYETNLMHVLNDLDINQVVLSGNALEHCVSATYFGAGERGFYALFLQKGILAEQKESLKLLYDTRPLVSYNALKGLLPNKK